MLLGTAAKVAIVFAMVGVFIADAGVFDARFRRFRCRGRGFSVPQCAEERVDDRAFALSLNSDAAVTREQRAAVSPKRALSLRITARPTGIAPARSR
ncbi:MAG: hypothetical protein IPI27_14250 [Betaproteobacteria bacterium]|nr:hypothetical protein [Betaproteobacteria bacterium]